MSIDINHMKELERQIFQEINMHCDFFVDKNHDNWTTFAPHHYARDPAILTEQFVNNIKNGANLLSVGCGRAYLEQFLVRAYNIDSHNIVIADNLEHNIPKLFEFHKFDMYNSWPDFKKKFDYIIFPESIVFDKIGPEEGMTHLLIEASQRLLPQGEIRIKGYGIADEIVKETAQKLNEKLDINQLYFGKDYLALKKN